MSGTWERCAVDGCDGATVGNTGRCVAHLSHEQFAALLSSTRSPIDARGVRVTAALIDELVARCTDEDGSVVFGACDFSHAEFVDEVRLAGSVFSGPVSFTAATFRAKARFSGATFERDADFGGTTFQGVAAFGGAHFAKASFRGARFEADAQFSGARWHGRADLEQATFGGETWFARGVFSGFAHFDGARFGPVSFLEVDFARVASFRDASFASDARFVDVSFGALARFDRARFAQQARFNGSAFNGEARFAGTRFSGTLGLYAVLCERTLILRSATLEGKLSVLATAAEGIDLSRAVCMQPASLSVAAPRILCQGTEFRAGVNLLARWADLVLDDAIFDGSSVVSGVSRIGGLNEEPVVDALRRPGGAVARRSIPRLASALRADLGGVIFDGIDLSETRMSGAKNLDRVRLNGSVVLARTPRGPRCGRSFPPMWWWSRRYVLGEEATWRALGRKPSGWPSATDRSAVHTLATAQDARQARRDAERIAAAYRDLRKGREELRNAPGAADLYYGEMEMRRHAAPRLSVERLLLSAYWLVSGYSLRAGRALACLLVTLTLAAMAFHQFGFADLRAPFVEQPVATAAAARPESSPGALPQDLHELRSAATMPEAWIYAAAAAVPGTTLPRARLTVAGQAITIVVRLLGPLFLGLALLSIRGRVKRN